MPELYSRMDDAGWLTPSIADILEQGAPPPGGDGSIRDYMLTIQRELADLETPAKIVNVRSMPSYTLYVARPETVGRLGSRRAVTPAEVRRSLAKIAEQHTDWSLGFIPRLQEDETTLGILLRTSAHRPLSLRRLLVRGNFRTASSHHTYTLGITLEQNLIVRDLHTTRHLLVIGADSAKIHLLRALLLTLIVLNTPSELRIILAGQGVEQLKALIASPHSLGRTVTQSDALLKILDGLRTEAQRRTAVFAEAHVSQLDDYNSTARETGKPTMPRILMMIDSLDDQAWNSVREEVIDSLLSVMRTEQDLGIHVILTTNEMNQYQSLRQAIKTHVLMRSVAKALVDQIPDFHPSLLRFVDAVIADYEGGRTTLTPVELCSTTNTELINAIAYWQQNRQQRKQEQNGDRPISGRTGVTDLLSLPDAASEELVMRVDDAPAEPALNASDHLTGTVDNDTMKMPLPVGPARDSLPLTHHAIALAAHLGWLSAGALQDIFGIDQDYARNLIEQLQQDGVLEAGNQPTPRFLRP